MVFLPDAICGGAMERATLNGYTEHKESSSMASCFKGLLLILAIAFVATSVSGCNTIRGVGKDIERGGQKIQGAADR